MPAATVRLLQLFSNPDTSLAEIVRILQSDPALAAKIVHASNTAHFSTGKKIADLHRAALVLGRKVITSLALSFSLAESSLRHGARAQEFREYWLQSIVQSTAMEVLSEKYAPTRTGEFVIAGLLMDIGRLALLSSAPDQYAVVLEEARRTPRLLHRLELEHLGTNHPQLSARFLSEWGMPDSLVRAVLEHHDSPFPAGMTDDSEAGLLAGAVRVAAAAGDYLCSPWRGPARVRLVELMRHYFRADEADSELFVSQVSRRADDAAELFNADAASLRSPLEIMALALQQLSGMLLQEDRSEGGWEEHTPRGPRCQGTHEGLIGFAQPSCLDAATFVYNSAHLRNSLVEAVRDAARRAASLGMLLVGVRCTEPQALVDPSDWDCILKHLTHGILRSIRPADVLARYGTSELAVLLHDTNEAAIQGVAERVHERVVRDVADLALDHRELKVAVVGLAGAPSGSSPAVVDRLQHRCESALEQALNDLAGGPIVLRIDRPDAS
jgi:diguanylate cyclase (GGDEF)-like protein